MPFDQAGSDIQPMPSNARPWIEGDPFSSNFMISQRLLRCFVAFLFCVLTFPALAERPNVVVIMSDDQGGGDYGFLGNEVIRTPQIDEMHRHSGLLGNFYVSPVCAPTRASLMTGRYNYRTRCIDTYVGRAMMEPDEVTLAEMLRDAGYQTGIYGKWHMGDNYPLRAMDQGFQESLIHRGGGIGQPSDPLGAEGKYTDPTLIFNGVEKPMKGYCTDIYFDAAMDFIDRNVAAEKPFFTYIATNAPHGPFHDVPPELLKEYQQVDFTPILVNQLNPKRLAAESDKLARIAAMITNIDENVGRLFEKLDELDIRENTIVVYLNDNGPNSVRYVGDMRGMKTAVDNGGIRSPLIFHWPSRVKAGTTSDQMCAHIDLLPTILDACDVDLPDSVEVDGNSFLPLLTGDSKSWPKRQLVFQTHRGNVPVRYHHFALHDEPWKLLHPSGFGKESFEGEPKFQLYDLSQDPRQENDLASQNPEVVARLKKAYDAWFDDVSSSREDNYAPPRIVIGTEHEPRTVLTRQDWRHVQGRPWGKDSNGFWLLACPETCKFEGEVALLDAPPQSSAIVHIGDQEIPVDIAPGKTRGHFFTAEVPEGELTLAVDVSVDGETRGPHQVILKRIP